MKIVPPKRLMQYISFEDGKVVLEKPLPFYLRPAFNRYCRQIEQTKQRRQEKMSSRKDSDPN